MPGRIFPEREREKEKKYLWAHKISRNTYFSLILFSWGRYQTLPPSTHVFSLVLTESHRLRFGRPTNFLDVSQNPHHTP
jgi:hypothetical protein